MLLTLEAQIPTATLNYKVTWSHLHRCPHRGNPEAEKKVTEEFRSLCQFLYTKEKRHHLSGMLQSTVDGMGAQGTIIEGHLQSNQYPHPLRPSFREVPQIWTLIKADWETRYSGS